MKIFAISDLHLSLGSEKPMDIFGSNWDRHWEKIEQDWQSRVGAEDLVLLPGDHSWGLKLEEALPDLQFIGGLPGRKILLKGNHDLWWQSRRKVEAVLPEGMTILQNDAAGFDGYSICGSRGWLNPGDEQFSSADEKIYNRELIRLEMSLKQAPYPDRIIAMVHYPPVNRRGEGSGFSDLLEQYGVRSCLYGHIHGQGLAQAFEGTLRGVRYQLVSADHLDFCLKRIV